MAQITIKDFLQQYGSGLQKDTDEATNDAVMAKIQELSTQGTEVVGFKDIVNFHNDQQQKSIDSQDANVFSEDYNIRKNDIGEGTLLGVGVAGLGGVGLRQGSKLLKSRYTQGRGVDTAKYLIRNLVNPTNSLSINFVEDEAINLMDYLGGLTPEEIKMIQREPMGNFRGLIKKIVADRNTVINARNAILQNNATKQVGYEILQPLADEINRLGIGGELGGKKQDLIELYDEVKGMLDKNGGSMSVADAEILKETAYESYDYSKLSKNAVDAKTMNRGLGSKLLGQGTKLGIEGAIGDPKLAQLNEQYGIIRTIEKNLGGNVTKISKMPRYTTIGMVRKELGEIVQSVPGISALGNLQGDLPDIVIEEKKLPKIITRIKAFGGKIKTLLNPSPPKIAKGPTAPMSTPPQISRPVVPGAPGAMVSPLTPTGIPQGITTPTSAIPGTNIPTPTAPTTVTPTAEPTVGGFATEAERVAYIQQKEAALRAKMGMSPELTTPPEGTQQQSLFEAPAPKGEVKLSPLGGIETVQPKNQVKYNQGVGYEAVRMKLSDADAKAARYGALQTKQNKQGISQAEVREMEAIKKELGPKVYERSKQLKEIAKSVRSKDEQVLHIVEDDFRGKTEKAVVEAAPKVERAAIETAKAVLKKGITALGSNEGFLPPGVFDKVTPVPASFPKGKQEYTREEIPSLIGYLMDTATKPLTAKQKVELEAAKTKGIQTPGAGNVAQMPTTKKIVAPVKKPVVVTPAQKKAIEDAKKKIGGPKFGLQTGF